MSRMFAAHVARVVAMTVAGAGAVVVVEGECPLGDERVGHFQTVGQHQGCVAENLVGRTVGDNPAGINDNDAAAARADKLHVVRGDHLRTADAGQLFHQLTSGAWVEPAGGFV